MGNLSQRRFLLSKIFMNNPQYNKNGFSNTEISPLFEFINQAYKEIKEGNMVLSGSYRTRTCDLSHVKGTLYQLS